MKEYALISPVESLFISKSTFELGVYMVYENDTYLEWLYVSNVASLVNKLGLKSIIDPYANWDFTY